MNKSRPSSNRPLSPHIQIYKPMFTMIMSIMNRLTGVGLYFAAFLLVWWLMAAASGPKYFNLVSDHLASWPGQAILLLASWGFFHHMLGGVRHFIWDFGKGFELAEIEFLARAGLIGSLALTALLWALI